jgi:hypothetical protein
VRPLGKLFVAKSTKTSAVKHVPVHPVLVAMLGEWKLDGWAEMMDRAPTPDDLSCRRGERSRSRTGEPFRGHDDSGNRWRHEDLPALGWRHPRGDPALTWVPRSEIERPLRRRASAARLPRSGFPFGPATPPRFPRAFSASQHPPGPRPRRSLCFHHRRAPRAAALRACPLGGPRAFGYALRRGLTRWRAARCRELEPMILNLPCRFVMALISHCQIDYWSSSHHRDSFLEENR